MKNASKKISSILPTDLLSKATKLTNKSQNDTLILALNELIRSFKRNAVFDMKGKLSIDFDVNQSRERSRF